MRGKQFYVPSWARQKCVMNEVDDIIRVLHFCKCLMRDVLHLLSILEYIGALPFLYRF